VKDLGKTGTYVAVHVAYWDAACAIGVDRVTVKAAVAHIDTVVVVALMMVAGACFAGIGPGFAQG
jgi:hypothetical protein